VIEHGVNDINYKYFTYRRRDFRNYMRTKINSQPDEIRGLVKLETYLNEDPNSLTEEEIQMLVLQNL
jgi:hypothetical protein